MDRRDFLTTVVSALPVGAAAYRAVAGGSGRDAWSDIIRLGAPAPHAPMPHYQMQSITSLLRWFASTPEGAAHMQRIRAMQEGRPITIQVDPAGGAVNAMGDYRNSTITLPVSKVTGLRFYTSHAGDTYPLDLRRILIHELIHFVQPIELIVYRPEDRTVHVKSGPYAKDPDVAGYVEVAQQQIRQALARIPALRHEPQEVYIYRGDAVLKARALEKMTNREEQDYFVRYHAHVARDEIRRWVVEPVTMKLTNAMLAKYFPELPQRIAYETAVRKQSPTVEDVRTFFQLYDPATGRAVGKAIDKYPLRPSPGSSPRR